MGFDWLLVAVVILILFAIFDLIVGVSNDAVNFLNSSIGSRVAPRYVIMIIASIGILVGVGFSSGMMEVARKGIFHPQFFTMPELMTIFLGVMLTDILLLDLFNTYGFPTSTTVSIVFELLGGAVAVSILKILEQGQSIDALYHYINTSKALLIISGILLSVVIAFSLGAIAQFITRIIFTFDYVHRLKRYGAIWGGVAFSFITYFILVKGAKGAFFISPATAAALKENAFEIITYIFICSAILLQIALFFKLNILKPIVLVGTFALAMAFAANDLVNFIGVPVAGFQSYTIANATDAPLTALMGAMDKKVPTPALMVMMAGVIMVVTLWISKKARTVTETEISIGNQGEGEGKFDSNMLSRTTVGIALRFWSFFQFILPKSFFSWVGGRLDTSQYKNIEAKNNEPPPAFDLLRASVNIMVASAVISYATSKKLPLSTTYVTFMVAMGTSLADLAWGRESAVYRIAGVFNVIGGWFFTAFSAFLVSAVIASVIYFLQGWALLILLPVIAYIIFQNHQIHKNRNKQKEMSEVFNLKKISDIDDSISKTFEHMSYFIKEVRESLNRTLNSLYQERVDSLQAEQQNTKKIQKWSNMIIANIFKCMRLLMREKANGTYPNYSQTVRRLQKISDSSRDIVNRSYSHIRNHHTSLTKTQQDELTQMTNLLNAMLADVENALRAKDILKFEEIRQKNKDLKSLAEKLNDLQIDRIRNGESKTRLSILYYAIAGNLVIISKQNLKLIEIFAESFGDQDVKVEFDMD
jgi:Na+/phosphate symporter